MQGNVRKNLAHQNQKLCEGKKVDREKDEKDLNHDHHHHIGHTDQIIEDHHGQDHEKDHYHHIENHMDHIAEDRHNHDHEKDEIIIGTIIIIIIIIHQIKHPNIQIHILILITIKI